MTRGRSACAALALLIVLLAGPAGAAPAPRPAAFGGSMHARELDLSDLVPAKGRLDAVWYVPAGRGREEVVVSWHYAVAHDEEFPQRNVLTLWHPGQFDRNAHAARWVPHVLIRASPFPMIGKSVRLADVTGDGHDDLLVTVMCADCNHATAIVSIYAAVGGRIRHIYGDGVMETKAGAVVHGRVITETAWGARHGTVWFDEPRGGMSMCCPAFRLHTFLRWSPHGWRTVGRRRLKPDDDRLWRLGYPYP